MSSRTISTITAAALRHIAACVNLHSFACKTTAATDRFRVASLMTRANRNPGLSEIIDNAFTMSVIDRAWREHLQAMSDLLDSLARRSADGTVPLPDYQREAALLFAAMDSTVNRKIIYGLFNFEVTFEES